MSHAEVSPASVARALIADRRRREQYFDTDLFHDPAWDIMLDLYAARREGRRVSISSACIAASVPSTTALRWIGILEDRGLLYCEHDPADGRRRHAFLTDRAFHGVAAYLATLTPPIAVTPSFLGLTATVSATAPSQFSDTDLLVFLARRLGMGI